MYNFFVIEHSCVKLTDCSAHFGGWFVAVGNDELNIKVMLCMMNQEAFVVRTFYSSFVSYVAVERQYCIVSVNVASTEAICQVVKHLNEIGSVLKCAKGHKL
jgi:hypothetical protein